MSSPNLHNKLLEACEGGKVAAIRTVIKLEPVGGAGDKISPPTHAGGQYAFETRVIDGRAGVTTVLLDSVQSQANRFEEALLSRVRSGAIAIPLLEVAIPGRQTLTSLSVPHRVHDAIFRDSTYQGKRFRESDLGQQMVAARAWNATAMFRVCPTALLLGTWDSQSEGGVNSAKFARALVSEIIGIDAERGVRTASRIDPLGIRAVAGAIYKSSSEQWTLDPALADQIKGKAVLYKSKGTPSEINHGNIPPTITDPEKGAGGVTFQEARQTTVLSFAQLRKLYFPLDGTSNTNVDVAGRAVIAALGLYCIALQIEEGYQLRSRCHLIPVEKPGFEWLGTTAAECESTSISTEQAKEALHSLYNHAKKLKLTWEEQPIRLEPQKKLVDLIAKSDASEAVED